MPEEFYAWLPRSSLLSFEELSRLVDAFLGVGVDKIRLTGGEPLLRRGLSDLVAVLAAKPGVLDLALTTNGVLLARHARRLREAGLRRVTVSLDTLRPDISAALTRRDDHVEILEGIRSLAAAGFTGTKIDTVVIKNVNSDELVDLLEFGGTVDAEVRFIEYMDVGGATRWAADKVFSREEILRSLEGHYGTIAPVEGRTSAPADRFALPDGTVFGIISSTTRPFCATCDRARLTADGFLYSCLYAQHGTDLRAPLRAGVSTEELTAMLRRVWAARRDRGAVDRLVQQERRPLVSVEELRGDPHREMHTRGG
jgi:cyclic pyranopterin phosphate synthase